MSCAVVNDPDTGSQIVNISLATAVGSTPTTDAAGAQRRDWCGVDARPYHQVPTAVNSAFGGSTTATVANDDYSLVLSTSQPRRRPRRCPFHIKIFAKNGPIPQTVASLAARVEQTINASLAVNWPGATVRCTAVDGGSGNQAIRVVGFLPGHEDAELSFAAPAGPLKDAAAPLGLVALASANVAHYTLGTGNTFGSQTASTAGTDGTGLPGTTQLIGDEISFTGIYALRKVDLFNLLASPTRRAPRPATRTRSIRRSIPNAIYARRDQPVPRIARAMLLVDPPPEVNDVASAVDWKTTGLAVHQETAPLISRACACRTRRTTSSSAPSRRPAWSPGSTRAPTARAACGRRRPAPRRRSPACRARCYKLSDAENGVLNPLGVNCFRIFPVYGTVVWGARTLVGADADGSRVEIRAGAPARAVHRGEPVPRHASGWCSSRTTSRCGRRSGSTSARSCTTCSARARSRAARRRTPIS